MQYISTPVLPPSIAIENVRWVSIKPLPNETNIDRIPSEIFSTFKNLHLLDIRSTIEVLTSQDFVAAPKLRKLFLPTNKIKIIEDFTFLNQSSLNRLWLADNKLTTLNRNTFTGLLELSDLSIDNNEIDTIEDGALELPRLESLNLRHNKIKSFADGTFVGTVSLKALHLDSNKFDSINLFLFTKLPMLEELTLSFTNSRLKDVKIESGSPSTSILKRIDLSGNDLANTTELEVLRIFPKLHVLDLSSNDFEKFDLSKQVISEIWPQLKKIILFEMTYLSPTDCDKYNNADTTIEITILC